MKRTIGSLVLALLATGTWASGVAETPLAPVDSAPGTVQTVVSPADAGVTVTYEVLPGTVAQAAPAQGQVTVTVVGETAPRTLTRLAKVSIIALTQPRTKGSPWKAAEVGTFDGKKGPGSVNGPQRVTYRILPPADGQKPIEEIYFQDPDHPEAWYSTTLLVQHPGTAGYRFDAVTNTVDEDGVRTITIDVVSWPLGDPLQAGDGKPT